MDHLKIVVSFDLENKYLKKIKTKFSEVEIKQSSKEKQICDYINKAEILFSGMFSPKIFKAGSDLRWIQTVGTGVDQFLIPEVINSKVIITNSGDIFSSTISEHTFAMMLSLTRKMRFFSRNQDKKEWNSHGAYLGQGIDELNNKTIGIIGLGTIGQKVAEKAKAFGMKVIATKREVLTQKPNHVDKLIKRENLTELLAESDFVVLTLPLTTETEGLIGESQLKGMKKTGYLLNVSRGKIVQEKMLVKALEKGWIEGAGLDVFMEEPLPAQSKLWRMDNVVITPHVAWMSRHFDYNVTDIFCENLKHYLNNEPLNYTIDKKRGY